MTTTEMTDAQFATHWREWADDALARSWAMVRDPATTSTARELHRLTAAISREEQVQQLWLSAERQGFDAAARRAGSWLRDAPGSNTFSFDLTAARADAAQEWVRIAYGRYTPTELADAVAGEA